MLEGIQNKKICSISCLSWTSVFAGALVAIGLSFLLNLFGLAIGLSAYTNSPEGQKILIAGGYFGMVASVMISMFLAGWVSGFLGKERCTNKRFGILYGFVTWCLALILSIFITANVGQFISIQEGSLARNELMVKLSTNINNASTDNGHTVKASVGTSDAQKPRQMSTLTKQESHVIGESLFLTFLLFIAGAIMSAYGGYCGMKRCRNEP